MNRLMVIVIWIFCLSACSSIPQSRPETVVSKHRVSSQSKPPLGRVDMANHSQVRNQLLRQLSQWKGVPYRYGGLSKSGVDCSGLIHLIFAEEFGIRIPRTTKTQILNGIVVDQSDLIPGDLVFFHTGFNQRHVGIYVGENQFIHSSSSRGVIASRLDSPYWQDAYWHSRRLVDVN